MKKIISVLIISVMLLICVPAFGETYTPDEKIMLLTQIVENTLDTYEYNYEYDAQNDLFDLEFSLDSALVSTKITIFIYDDMVSVVAYSPVTVAPENLNVMAKYLTLVNDSIYYAHFRMSYDDGIVACRSHQLVEETLPGFMEISVLLEMPINYMDDFGDGIAQISVDGADPDEAFQAAMDNRI